MNTEKVPNLRVLALCFEPTLNAIFPRIIYIENSLKGLRDAIGCKCVTCTEIEVEGKKYDLWSDDEALLGDNPVPTLYLNDDLIIFGNVIFAKNDGEGETIGMTLSDLITLRHFIHTQVKKFEKFLKKERN